MAGYTAKTEIDLEHFENSVNSAATRVRGLWLGYIALIAYLIITVGAVTHRDLLLENPVKLPVLNVDLSLLGFFAIAPIFFLINHFYLLLHLAGLGRRIREYNEAIDSAIEVGQLQSSDEDTRRRKLDSFVIVQAFGGTSEERSTRVGSTGWFLKAIIWITVVIAPVLMLQQMQIYFLPYQNAGVTWVHRVVVLSDLALLWLFWPAIHRGFANLQVIRPWGDLKAAVAGICCLAVVVFSLLIATFPGERMDRSGIGGEIDRKMEGWRTPQDQVFWRIKEWLFEGGVDQVTGRRASWFSRTLVIPDGDFVDDEELAKLERLEKDKKLHERSRLISLRGRDLRGAVLQRADLRNADFTGAHLEGADLSWAKLDGARFDCGDSSETPKCANLEDARLRHASLRVASFKGANIQRTKLSGADLQGAIFFEADLQGASLFAAKAEGASFDYADLQGSTLFNTNLQGASLSHANLQGATLFQANLQGADLESTDFQGALLSGARLQGASLDSANLRGTMLTGAILHGAILDAAILHGAMLDSADLQGASLADAELQHAELKRSLLWRACGAKELPQVFIDDANLDPAVNFDAAISSALDGVLDDNIQDQIRARLSVLKPTAITPAADLICRNFWLEKILDPVNEDTYRKLLSATLKEAACDAENTHFVAKGLATWGQISAVGPRAVNLAILLLKADIDTCPGAVGIDEDGRQALQEIIENRWQYLYHRPGRI